MDRELENLNENEQEKLDGTPSNVKDENGYINIKFQLGPVKEHGVNGTTIEDVIEILVKRLEGFNDGPFRCRENSLAITHLQEAQNWLERRTGLRKSQDVEGENKAHKS